HGHHLITLAEPKQSVVDEDADELIADRRVQERGDYRRIDAAGEREQNTIAADPLPDPLDVIGDDVLCGPRRRAAAHVAHEASEDLEAVLRVGDLGMELQAVDPALGICDGGERRVSRLRDRLEARRQALHAIAVAHPDLERRLRSAEAAEAAEEWIVFGQHDLGIAVLALRGRADLAAEPR